MTVVSVALRLPCSCPSEGQHAHGVPIQSSINFNETLFRITREWKPNRSKSWWGRNLSINHIPDSWLSLLPGYDFDFPCQPPRPPICECHGLVSSLRIFWYLLASTGISLGPLHFLSKSVFLSKILAAFPFFLQKNATQSTIAFSVAGAGGTLETDQMIVRPKSRASFETRDPLP